MTKPRTDMPTSPPADSSPEFQPTMLGHTIYFGDEGDVILGKGMITDETQTEIYFEAIIEGEACNSWMSKAEYWERLGVAD
jgi:hypothetical protein